MASKSYDDWPVKSVRLSSLRLDAENPRLENPSADNDQRAICRELIEHEGVEKLAKDIVQQGYYPTEMMVVLRDSPTSYTVLEGNRRTAALKALTNPQFAPPKRKGRFEAMQREGAGRIPDKIKVVVAPDRMASRPIILNKHTASGIEKWSPVAQARYIETMVQEGYSADQIAREMSITVPIFLRRFRDAKLYQLVTSLELSPEIRAHVGDHRQFKISVLQRIAESSEGREWLGLEADDEHGWVIRTNVEDFRNALARIVTDIFHDKVSTRKLDTADDIKAYLAGLSRTKPAKRTGPPATASGVAGRTKAKASPSTAPASPRVTTTRSTSLLPDDSPCDLDLPRVHKMIKEIESLNMHKYTNAVALLYRALVDMAAASYVDAKGLTAVIKSRLGKKGASAAHWMPSLDQMLQHLAEHADPSDFPIAPSARKALKKFVSDNRTAASMEGLNGYAHNRFESPNVQTLEDIANRLRPVLAVLLQKPV